jgi:hypothetical protein
LAAGADQGVGGGIVLLVPAAADLVEPAAARPVAGHIQVGLEGLDVQHRGAVQQVDPAEVDPVAADGDDPDQAQGEVVGAHRGTSSEHADPLTDVLEQERHRPEPVVGERPGAHSVGLPGLVEEADEVGGVEAVQPFQSGGVLLQDDQAPRLVGVAGGLDGRFGQGPVGRSDIADRPKLHLLQRGNRLRCLVTTSTSCSRS